MENKRYFIETYNCLKEEFKVADLFDKVQKTESNKLIWPNSNGVYVIWKNSSDAVRNLIYIGSTGKFKRNKEGKVELNGGTFNQRVYRWTPYRFCKSNKDGKYKDTLRYGPKFPNVNIQGKHKYDEDAYSHAVPYNELVIHRFNIPSDHPKYTGSYIESTLLTSYLKDTGTLPPANNSL
jgi:hypothetical protein